MFKIPIKMNIDNDKEVAPKKEFDTLNFKQEGESSDRKMKQRSWYNKFETKWCLK